MASNGTFSVIGADIVIRGDLEASADLHVDGTVQGDIACASLVQGESSRIEGAINAETARLSGTDRDEGGRSRSGPGIQAASASSAPRAIPPRTAAVNRRARGRSSRMSRSVAPARPAPRRLLTAGGETLGSAAGHAVPTRRVLSERRVEQ